MKKIAGYVLVGLSVLCFISILFLWVYMIWTPNYDYRLEATQIFLAFLMLVTGFGGGMLATIK